MLLNRVASSTSGKSLFIAIATGGIIEATPECNPDYPVRFFIIPVVTQFIGHKKHDDKAGSNPDGQSGNIDERESFIPHQFTKSHQKIIPEHSFNLFRS
jgi:hypothetical protein